MRLPSLPRLLPARRRTRIILAIALAVPLYLVALAVIPALLGGGDDAAADRAAALRAISAGNWGLVVPEDRAALARAVDRAWRDLRAYRTRYVSGTPTLLAADTPETESRSSYVLDSTGRITAQHDTNDMRAESPASGGREEHFEGYRILTAQPYMTSRGRRSTNAELVYQRMLPGVWVCERSASDLLPPPPPGLDFATAGDAGFADIDGQRVRGFQVALGAFGLRAPAIVWVDVATLRVRRQEIESTLPGRREVWTYSNFDEPDAIVPPTGVTCQDT